MSKGRRAASTLEMLLLSLINRAGVGVSGYELAAALREPVPLIWPVKHSQIYPALAALEAKGDLTGEWVEQRGRPNKKIYRPSDQGRARLQEWLVAPRSQVGQDEVLLIAYNLHMAGMPVLREALAAYRRQAEAEAAQLEARCARAKSAGSPDRVAAVSLRSQYEFALRARRARVEWCDWLLEHAEAATPPESRARKDKSAAR
jgi:DNA-binding PadR family transcriptional regulator